MKLDLATALFPENRVDGLMICGIKWGGEPYRPQEPQLPSFFSDALVNSYRFRNRLLRWFELWGHPLVTERGHEGPFERSISHMNWLPDQARSVRGRDIWTECVAHRQRFLRYAATLKPKAILFCGLTLLRALNTPECLRGAEELFGRFSDPRFLRKDVGESGRLLKRFTFGFQVFERCQVLGVPHPTGSIGLSDAYVAAFRSEIEPILCGLRQDPNA